MTFDEMLEQALENTVDSRVERILTVEKEHKFSLAYRLWEYRMLRKLRRNRFDKSWTLRKARRIVTTVMIAASTLLIGITACAAVTIGRFVFDTKPDHFGLFIENFSSDKTALEEYYGLPAENGWELTGYKIMYNSTTLNYECCGKIISFCQNVIYEGGMENTNIEGAVSEPVSLYKENDGIILSFSEDQCAVYWVYDGYLLYIYGNITKDEAVNLAHSIKNIDLE